MQSESLHSAHLKFSASATVKFPLPAFKKNIFLLAAYVQSWHELHEQQKGCNNLTYQAPASGSKKARQEGKAY